MVYGSGGDATPIMFRMEQRTHIRKTTTRRLDKNSRCKKHETLNTQSIQDNQDNQDNQKNHLGKVVADLFKTEGHDEYPRPVKLGIRPLS